MAGMGSVTAVAEDRTVDISSVDRELRQLWQSIGQSDKDDDSPITRVSTVNLVALATSAQAAARVSEAGTAITGRYPCRVILATADESGSDGMDASISIYCHPLHGTSSSICCERISLYASGKSVNQLAWAISPLLAPDVPVYTWLQGDIDPSGDLCRRIVGLADRVVVDLQENTHPERLLQVMVGYEKLPRPVATDLGWRRAASWREFTASLFDPPALRSYVPALSRLEIGYAPGGKGWCAAHAVLIGGWACARLGWQAQGAFRREEGRWELDVTTPAGPGALVINPDAATGAHPGAITSIVFPATDTCSASFSVHRSSDGQHVDMKVERPGMPPLVWRQPKPSLDTADLLGQELERPHGSPLFMEAARFLVGVL